MENDSLLEAFAQADGEGRLALVKANKPGPGFSEQFFYRVARLMGENPHSARELAEAWDIVSRYGDDPSFAWRAKGAYDRLRGDWLGSAKAFVKSGSLARNPIEQLSFQTGAIDSFARAGKTADAVRLGKTIATNWVWREELGSIPETPTCGQTGTKMLESVLTLLWLASKERLLDWKQRLHDLAHQVPHSILSFQADHYFWPSRLAMRCWPSGQQLMQIMRE